MLIYLDLLSLLLFRRRMRRLDWTSPDTVGTILGFAVVLALGYCLLKHWFFSGL